MVRRLPCRTTVLSFSLLALAAFDRLPRAAAQSVLLAPRYEAQREAYLEFSQEVDQALTGGKLGDATVKTRLTHTFGLLQTVEAVASDGARVRLTFDRVAQQIASQGFPAMTYDSDAPAADGSDALLADVYRPMLGMPLTMEVGTDGEIRSFRGMAPILERVRESAAGNIMFERLKLMLCDEIGRCMWGDSLLVLFPNRTVRVGDTWMRTLYEPNPLMGPLAFAYEVRLEKIESVNGRELAELSFHGDIRPAEGATGPADCTVCYELDSGTFEGTATIDVQRGECIRQTEIGEVTLKMTVPDAATPQPDRMTLTQRTRLNFRSTPAADRQATKRPPPPLPPVQFQPKP